MRKYIPNTLHVTATASAALAAYSAVASSYAGGAAFPVAVGAITSIQPLRSLKRLIQSYPMQKLPEDAISFIKNGIVESVFSKGAIAAAAIVNGIYDSLKGNPQNLINLSIGVGIPLGLSAIGDACSYRELRELEKLLNPE